MKKKREIISIYMVQEAVRALLTLINDILDFSKSSRPKLRSRGTRVQPA